MFLLIFTSLFNIRAFNFDKSADRPADASSIAGATTAIGPDIAGRNFQSRA